MRILSLDSTGFKDIDVENLLNLAILDISLTHIEFIEISQLSHLEALWMENAPVRSVSRTELKLESLMRIDLRSTKIGKLNLRGCPVLKDAWGADQPGREVSTAEGVDRTD